MMYQAYQTHSDLMWPVRALSRLSLPFLEVHGERGSGPPAHRQAAAACKVLELAEVTHRRPAWQIGSVVVAGEPVPVVEEAVHATPFATLLRFRKEVGVAQPKVLVVAPMSGHFATLLRDTVRTLLIATTCTSPTGTTSATSRSAKAASASTNTPSTSSTSWPRWAPARASLPSASPASPHSPR